MINKHAMGIKASFSFFFCFFDSIGHLPRNRLEAGASFEGSLIWVTGYIYKRAENQIPLTFCGSAERPGGMSGLRLDGLDENGGKKRKLGLTVKKKNIYKQFVAFDWLIDKTAVVRCSVTFLRWLVGLGLIECIYRAA